MSVTAPATFRPWIRPALRLTAAIVAAAAIFHLFPLIFERLLTEPAIAALSPPAVEGLFIAAAFGALALVAAIGLLLAGERPRWGVSPALGAAAGLALGGMGLIAAIALSALAGVVSPSGASAAPIAVLLAGTLATLFQAASEELYFRGWLQPALETAWGRWPGLVVTAAAFAGLHFVAAASAPLSLVTLFLGGLLFGLLAQRSGGLALPVGAHFAWNWCEIHLFGASPNPGVGSFGAIWDLELAGAAWWGGSDEGLNASLSSIFALTALLAAVSIWPRAAPAARRRWPGVS